MRGRPPIVAWNEMAQELAERLAQARSAEYRSIQRWVSWYRSGGLEEVLRQTPGQNAKGRGSKLTRTRPQRCYVCRGRARSHHPGGR